MADGNCATVDIQPLIGNSQGVAAVEHLNRKRLVELPQANVLELYSGALEQPRNRKHRADPHLVGLAPRDGKSPENPQGLDIASFRELRVHDDTSAGAVGKLAGVAGTDDSAGHRRPDFGN